MSSAAASERSERVLVTGANGFVGRYLTRELRARGYDVAGAGHSREGGALDHAIDLRDEHAIGETLRAVRPSVVFHLAAQAFVPRATEDPLETYDVNVTGTARLIEAVRRQSPMPRVILASSAEVYGKHDERELPLDESATCRPMTPYAASKLAAEAILLASSRTYGFGAIVTRAFNHIGPGQSERFAVPAFARRLAAIAAGAPPLLPVGNLEAKRDFLDVRDVVRAYADLAERGAPGEIYNVSSGRTVRMAEILRQLVLVAHVPVEIREDPALMRPADVPASCGDNAKLRAATGWAPALSLANSLRDVYDGVRAGIGVA